MREGNDGGDAVYEYPRSDCSTLFGMKGRYVVIPRRVIEDFDLGEKRVTVMSYLLARCGKDDTLFASPNDIAEWSGRKPNKNKQGTPGKLADAMDIMFAEGYASADSGFSENGMSARSLVTVDTERISSEAGAGRFAVMYLDEIQSIFSYGGDGDARFANADINLMVFAYLRSSIFRRPNKMALSDVNIDNMHDRERDLSVRRDRMPEAFSGYYNEIADSLGITWNRVSNAVDALVRLGLIYVETLPRALFCGQWHTNYTVFCNTYKRDGNLLLASGKDYYLAEAASKKKMLRVRKSDD